MRHISILFMLAALAAGQPVAGQSYPTKPIRLIVPFEAGGGATVMVRPIAEKLSSALE